MVSINIFLCRNLRLHQQQLGLARFRDTDLAVQTVLRLLAGLAYVPIPSIETVLDRVILVKVAEIVDRPIDEEEAEEHRDMVSALKQYLNYFLTTYVGTMDPVTKRRGRSKISPKLWNKYKFIMEGEQDLTNNVAENFNKVSKVICRRWLLSMYQYHVGVCIICISQIPKTI